MTTSRRDVTYSLIRTSILLVALLLQFSRILQPSLLDRLPLRSLLGILPDSALSLPSLRLCLFLPTSFFLLLSRCCCCRGSLTLDFASLFQLLLRV
jgi:hypothetical protein